MENLFVERLHRPWRLYVAGSSPSSSSSTPFVSGPSSPCSDNVRLSTRSAPSSPHRHSWTDYDHSSGLQVAIPFSWEESPGTPKHQAFKDSESHFSKDSEFEFRSSSLRGSSIENSVDNLTETGFTFFSAPSSPGREAFRCNEKIGGYELQYSAREESDGFEFASKRSDADSVTSAQMSSADELFFQGLILPLKPPPRLKAFAFRVSGDGSRAVYDKGLKNDSSASQSPKSAWKWRRRSGVCDFGSSCFDTNPADTSVFLGKGSSFSRSSNRKKEWIKTLSRFSFLRKGHKDSANLPSSQSFPKHHQTKSGKSLDIHGNMSNSFPNQEQRDYFATKTFADVHSPEKMVLHHSYNNSKCSKNDCTLSVNCSLSQRWSRISAKSIQQTSSTNSSSTPPDLLSLTQNQQHKGRGSSEDFPRELEYRTTKEPYERTTLLPYKQGSLGCFNFAILHKLSSRLETDTLS